MFFSVPGIPGSKGRPRFAKIGKGVRTYTDAKTASYEDKVRLCAINAGVKPLTGPVGLSIRAMWPSRKPDRKTKPREEEWRTSRPDLDNIIKVVCDALNGVAFTDDSQVAYVIARKLRAAQGEAPELQVLIEELEFIC